MKKKKGKKKVEFEVFFRIFRIFASIVDDLQRISDHDHQTETGISLRFLLLELTVRVTAQSLVEACAGKMSPAAQFNDCDAWVSPITAA